MGHFDFNAMQPEAARLVPKSHAEWDAERIKYNVNLRAMRLKYRDEWDARRAREAAAVKAFQDGMKKDMRQSEARRAKERAASDKLLVQRMTNLRAELRVRKAMSLRANELRLARVRRARPDDFDCCKIVTGRSLNQHSVWCYCCFCDLCR